MEPNHEHNQNQQNKPTLATILSISLNDCKQDCHLQPQKRVTEICWPQHLSYIWHCKLLTCKSGLPNTHTFIMSLGRTLWAHCSAPLPPSIHPSLLHCCNGISIAALAAVFKRRGRLHSRSSLWQLKNEMDCHWPVVIKTGHESQICVMWKKERTQKMKRGNKSSYFPMSNH